KNVLEQMPVDQQSGNGRDQHGKTQYPGQQQTPGIGNMQANMRVNKEAAERVIVARAEYFLPGSVQRCGDISFAIELITYASADERSVRGALMPVKEGPQIMVADLEQVDPFMIFSRRPGAQTPNRAVNRPFKRGPAFHVPRRPDADLFRKDRRHAREYNRIEQQTQHDARPAVNGDHQLGLVLFQVNHQWLSCTTGTGPSNLNATSPPCRTSRAIAAMPTRASLRSRQ